MTEQTPTFLRAPAGGSALSYGSQTFTPDENGVVAIPAELVPVAISHGFTPVTVVIPVSQVTDAPSAPTEGEGSPIDTGVPTQEPITPPVDGTPVDGTPVDGAPVDGAPADTTPAAPTSGGIMSGIKSMLSGNS